MNASSGSGLRLNCQPGKAGNRLVFAYSLQNQGEQDIFVMDATSSVDPTTREARANDQAAVVILTTDGDAIIGKFPAPLPTDRQIAMPVLPLASRLPPGATIERRLEIPVPLAETSPYFADLTLRRYEIVAIAGVVFTIGYWQTGIDDFVTRPVEYAPDLVRVLSAGPAARGRRATQRFPTKGLELFKRTDHFPRTLD